MDPAPGTRAGGKGPAADEALLRITQGLSLTASNEHPIIMCASIIESNKMRKTSLDLSEHTRPEKLSGKNSRLMAQKEINRKRTCMNMGRSSVVIYERVGEREHSSPSNAVSSYGMD